MNQTKFGSMARLLVNGYLNGRMEVLRFERTGTAHAHAMDEVAVCVSGRGYVYIQGKAHWVAQGDHVVIKAGDQHFMVPSGLDPLCMMILYKATI